MKSLINRAKAHITGRAGQRNHRKIVDDVFNTRDALEASADQMLAEMEANSQTMSRLVARNKELAKSRQHALGVAARLGEFFLPR